MTDFNGWLMPLQYTSITEEHQRVRQAAGLFDLGHMGRIRLRGPDRIDFAQRMTTVDVAGTEEGGVSYGFLCNDRGGIIDDVTIYRAGDYVFLVVNSANRLKVLDWLNSNRAANNVEIEDATETLGMIAIQGPQAEAILQKETDFPLGSIGYYRFGVTIVSTTKMLISRTGYTGEDGFEMYMGSLYCERVWEALLKRGGQHGLVPVGLGARDTLRLEAAMPLYGNELSETITPFDAGLRKFVNLKKPDFVGREALIERSQAQHEPRRLCCLVMEERSIPRKGYKVFAQDMRIGEVTSGTFSPTLGQGIAMAYLDIIYAQKGNRVAVEIRGKRYPARVVQRPFYSRRRE